MHRQLRLPHVHVRRPVAMLTVALAGFATAALVGIAVAKSFTLKKDGNAQVTNQKGVTVHEGIVTNANGFAVYTLSGDTAKHPKCTKASGCFTFWPPVKVSSAKKLSKAPGINGKLSRPLASQRLHAGDAQRPSALHVRQRQSEGQGDGEGVQGFGGTWHVSKTSAPKGAATTAPTSTLPPPTTSTAPGTTMTSPPPTTTTYPYPYP